MKKNFGNYLSILFAYGLSWLLTMILGNTFLRTACNAIAQSIWGPETVEFYGTLLTQWVMLLLWPNIAFVVLYIRKVNDMSSRCSYKTKLREQPYIFSEEVRSLFCSRLLWGEVLFVGMITVIYVLFNGGFWLALLNIPLFVLFELLATAKIHQIWRKEI